MSINNVEDQNFFMEYLAGRMPIAAKKYKDEIIAIGLDEDITEENKEVIRTILASPQSLRKLTEYINEQNFIEEYAPVIQKTYGEDVEDIDIVGYIFEGKQYNFIKSTENSKFFPEGKWYMFEEVKDEPTDEIGVLIFYSTEIDNPDNMSLTDPIQVLKDATTSFRILREIKFDQPEELTEE